MIGVVQPLLMLNFALATAILAVGLSRAALRRVFGVQAAYAVWAAVPVAGLAGFLPRADTGFTVLPMYGEGGLAAVGHAASQTGSAVGTALLALWLTGALATVLILGWRQAAYLSWLGDLEPTPGDRRRFTAQRDGAGPAVIGFLRPRIVTGRDFGEAFGPQEQLLILAHEREHVRRGDVIVNALGAAARCAFWFNPVVHWATGRIREDQELACDAAVLRRYPN